MNNRKMTQDEQNQIIALMTEAGFTFYPNEESMADLLTCLWFEIPLADDERATIQKNMGKSHFVPHGNRHVVVFNNYITSHVRGTFRGYRSRHTDTSNIFSFIDGEDNPVENCKQFIVLYNTRKYNRS